MAQAKGKDGRIITFYSYKGGTGRSMALANIAWILASNGNRVLAVDWDLEAPGLHRYFSPFLEDKDLTAAEGIINFVNAYKLKVLTPPPKEETLPDDWYVASANIRRFACPLNWNFNGGRLDLVPAGRQDPSYSTLVNSFDWREFYERLGGANFLEATKRQMRKDYDYILIDSRTGVSDTSGICTIQMPDDLVICHTLNNQSIRGASAVAAVASAQRSGIRIFPVPMRVDPFEKKKLDLRRQLAKEKFADFPSDLDPVRRDSYRAKAQIPYIPYYAYEEILASFGDTIPAEAGSLLESIERLIVDLFDSEIKAVTLREGDRQRILAEFEGSADRDLITRVEKSLELLSASDVELAKRFLTRLVRVTRADENVEDKCVAFPLAALDDQSQKIVDSLVAAEILLVQHGDIRFVKDSFVRSWQRLREWVDDDRDFLLWRQDLWKKAADWHKDDKLLLRSSDLTEADKWFMRRKGDLLRLEIDYIETSLQRKKMRDRTSFAISSIAVLLFVILFNYFRADEQWRRQEIGGDSTTPNRGATEMTALAKGRLLTGSPGGFQIWDPTNRVPILSGSGSTSLNTYGDSLLLRTPNQTNLLNLSTFKQYPISLGSLDRVLFDQSGRFLLVWRFGSSPDARSILFKDPLNVEVRNATDQSLIGTIKTLYGPVFSYAAYVTQGGDRLVFNAANGVSIWDIGTGLEIANFRTGSYSRSLAIDGKRSLIALLGSIGIDKGTLMLFDFQRSEKIAEVVLPTGETTPFQGVHFSADDSLLIVENGDKGLVMTMPDLAPATGCSKSEIAWSIKGGFLVCEKDSSDAFFWRESSSKPQLIKGLSLATVGQSSTDAGRSFFINNDATRLLVIRNTGYAELWNLSAGTKIGDLNTSVKDSSGNEFKQRVTFADFTLDGNALSLRLEGGVVALYSQNGVEQLAVLDNAGGSQQSIYYDSKCHRANVWTDAGRVLRYTGGKKVFGLFIPASRCAN